MNGMVLTHSHTHLQTVLLLVSRAMKELNHHFTNIEGFCCVNNFNTYIIIGHSCCMCDNFFNYEWLDLQFNVDCKRTIFKEIIFAERLPENRWEKVVERNIFQISFYWSCLTSTWTVTSNKPAYFLLKYGAYPFMIVSNAFIIFFNYRQLGAG